MVQERLRVSEPDPQVTLQAPQADQPLQPPSTKRQKSTVSIHGPESAYIFTYKIGQELYICPWFATIKEYFYTFIIFLLYKKQKVSGKKQVAKPSNQAVASDNIQVLGSDKTYVALEPSQ